jgi:HD superfamily phosphodiesterase
MLKVENRIYASVEVPASAVIDRAIEYARQTCEPYLFNHVMRSWLFAVRLGQLSGIPHDAEIVAVGTLLHDITLNEAYAGPRRFEVEAADLVRSFAAEAGMDDRRASLI